MHHLLLVTLAPEIATSTDARCEAYSRLADDPSFCGEGGRLGSPLADWFVIGGRWSGELQKALFGEPYVAAFTAEFPRFAGSYFAASLVDEHHVAINQFWQRFGGTNDHPFCRDSYQHLGYSDDAMLIDRPLYDMFLKEHEGEDSSGDRNFADLDGDPVGQDFIGRKWLVVVDYHN